MYVETSAVSSFAEMPLRGRRRFCLRPKRRRRKLGSRSSDAWRVPYIELSVRRRESRKRWRGFEVEKVERGAEKLGVRKSRFRGLAKCVAGRGTGDQRCE